MMDDTKHLDCELSELLLVVRDVDEAMQSDDAGEFEEELENSYRQDITIEFEPSAARYSGFWSLTVSIHDLLSLAHHLFPKHDAERLFMIRDAYYSTEWYTDLHRNNGQFTPEERAIARWEVEQLKSVAIEKKLQLERDLQGATDIKEELERVLQPFELERATLRATEENLYIAVEALDEEWFEFVVASRSSSPPSEDWLKMRRSELEEKTGSLINSWQDYYEEWEQLCNLAYDHAERQGMTPTP